MDELEWLACADPQLMLELLRGKASDRKVRLFSCACCRRIWHLLTDERHRQAVGVAERHAEGLASYEELREACIAGWVEPVNAATSLACDDAFIISLTAERGAVPDAGDVAARNGERAAQCGLIRDIWGSPFHPVLLALAWLTPDVTAIVTSIYEDRAFDHLPILADALEEAGCAHLEILGHLRGPGPHVRGCWAVDAILARE